LLSTQVCFNSHSASSQPSQRALAALREAASSAYPAGSSSGPLKFDLEVVEHPPTADQLRTIASYVSTSPSAFLSGAHPAAANSSSPSNDSAEGVAEAAQKAPKSFKWPVVVDWDAGRAIVGSADVKSILEELRKKRDGQS
jgi:arsenate reductase-like glutaredoxin family protein